MLPESRAMVEAPLEMAAFIHELGQQRKDGGEGLLDMSLLTGEATLRKHSRGQRRLQEPGSSAWQCAAPGRPASAWPSV